MDRERYITVEQMEEATASLLENGKKVGAVFGKGLGQFDAAVTVGIGLDDGGNLDVRTDVFADLAHIVSGCVQVDLGPDGAARKIHGTFICIHRYRLPIGNVIYISLS